MSNVNNAAALPATEVGMPLYVDLDGTLVRSDVAQEALIAALKAPKGAKALVQAALTRNVAYIKSTASEISPVDAARLPYNQDVVSYVRSAHDEGRRVVLATAADTSVARAVAEHLGIFDETLASTPETNLKGRAKLSAIEADCGGAPFEYLGDSRADLPIWQAAAARGFVNPHGPARALAAQTGADASLYVDDTPPVWRGLLKAMRPHQWLKNVLVFVPLFFAHAYGDVGALIFALLAFVSMSLLTSGTYLVNDLFDIAADRRHPKKRKRPFADGTVKPVTGGIAALGLVSTAILLAFSALGPAFALALLTYLVLTTSYTFVLKQYSTIDVIVLGLLFTIRIVAGAAATGILLSAWLLTFSLFFFTGLAYLKRYIELTNVSKETKLPSRNYWGEEVATVQCFGITTAALSLLTLSQYLMSEAVQTGYPAKDLLWMVIPLAMFWTYRMWMWASRGKVDDDPVLFALKDNVSRATLGLIIALVVAARHLTIPQFLT